MIRENGDALIRNFNEWHVVDWKETEYGLSSCASLSEMTVDLRKVANEEHCRQSTGSHVDHNLQRQCN
jgi:hypothetical protein